MFSIKKDDVTHVGFRLKLEACPLQEAHPRTLELSLKVNLWLTVATEGDTVAVESACGEEMSWFCTLEKYQR